MRPHPTFATRLTSTRAGWFGRRRRLLGTCAPSTQQAVEAKTREAEDAARARAREILGEARALRERVLTDLNERRTDLERQIGELRASRGKLVEVYELLERVLLQATRTIAEEPAMPAPSVAPPTSDVDAPEPDRASPDVGVPAVPHDGDTGSGDAEAQSSGVEAEERADSFDR